RAEPLEGLVRLSEERPRVVRSPLAGEPLPVLELNHGEVEGELEASKLRGPRGEAAVGGGIVSGEARAKALAHGNEERWLETLREPLHGDDKLLCLRSVPESQCGLDGVDEGELDVLGPDSGERVRLERLLSELERFHEASLAEKERRGRAPDATLHL